MFVVFSVIPENFSNDQQKNFAVLKQFVDSKKIYCMMNASLLARTKTFQTSLLKQTASSRIRQRYFSQLGLSAPAVNYFERKDSILVF